MFLLIKDLYAFKSVLKRAHAFKLSLYITFDLKIVLLIVKIVRLMW